MYLAIITKLIRSSIIQTLENVNMNKLITVFQLVVDLLTYRIIQPILTIEAMEIFSCNGIATNNQIL